jgi:cyanate permease
MRDLRIHDHSAHRRGTVRGKVLGRLLGVVLAADGVAEATSPMLVGYLRDTTGSYRTGFVLLIAVALAGTLAIAFLPRRGAPSMEASHV